MLNVMFGLRAIVCGVCGVCMCAQNREQTKRINSQMPSAFDINIESLCASSEKRKERRTIRRDIVRVWVESVFGHLWQICKIEALCACPCERQVNEITVCYYFLLWFRALHDYHVVTKETESKQIANRRCSLVSPYQIGSVYKSGLFACECVYIIILCAGRALVPINSHAILNKKAIYIIRFIVWLHWPRTQFHGTTFHSSHSLIFAHIFLRIGLCWSIHTINSYIVDLLPWHGHGVGIYAEEEKYNGFYYAHVELENHGAPRCGCGRRAYYVEIGKTIFGFIEFETFNLIWTSWNRRGKWTEEND